MKEPGAQGSLTTTALLNPKEKATQVFAIRLSLAVGVLMLGGKWYAYVITGSAAILSDAAESLVHIAAVAFAAFSMWLSFRPPDESHPYGHDKVSYFSAGTEGSLIILAAAFIIFESIRRLVAGVELFNLDTGTLFVFGASAINLGLGGYLVWQGKRSKSLILIANGKHVLTDSWTSFGVVAGLLLVYIPAFGPLLPYGTGNVVGDNPDINALDGKKSAYLQGKPTPPVPQERGWEDTVVTYPGQVTRILVRWAPTELPANTSSAQAYFPFDPASSGQGYVWHCHIVDHEDNEMMRPDEVVPNLNSDKRAYKQGVDY